MQTRNLIDEENQRLLEMQKYGNLSSEVDKHQLLRHQLERTYGQDLLQSYGKGHFRHERLWYVLYKNDGVMRKLRFVRWML
jgi:hypothetical protein